MVLQTFRTTLPNVHAHLQNRTYFCDYLLQTGIFANPALDRQHQALYDRIFHHYLERYQNRELFGRGNDLERMTQNSCNPISDDFRHELLSVAVARDGNVVQSVGE